MKRLAVAAAFLLAACHSPEAPRAELAQPDAAEPSAIPEPAAGVTDRAAARRAVEAVIWGMPAVNTELMYQAFVRLKGGPNQIVYWSGLPDWKNQTLTPNPDAIYLMPFFNTKDGPIVLEIPPASGDGSITGNVDDIWQQALEDVGPAGVDQGRGCKCLILPPGYTQPVPAGYTALPSSTYQGYALLRSILKSGSEADVAKAVEYGRRIKLYPLSQASNPPQTTMIDARGAEFDATIAYDLRFFQSLDRIVQAEPWLERDRVMIDQLKAIGIEKGKSFNPDARMQQILKEAAIEAHEFLDANYAKLIQAQRYYPDGHWAVPASPDVIAGQADYYAKTDVYPVDSRGTTYSIGFVGIKHLGAGQFYLMSDRDKNGKPLTGAETYRLTVPAHAPVKQYWSATAYDRRTHAFIREMPYFSRASTTPELKRSPDGSVDIFFGPKAPAGKESNWIPTKAGGEFEVLFRVYGPEQAFTDKSWKLPDIERVAQ